MNESTKRKYNKQGHAQKNMGFKNPVHILNRFGSGDAMKGNYALRPGH